MLTITGHAAISYARAARLPVSYADPTAEARDDLSIGEATAIAAEDPSLVYVDIGEGRADLIRETDLGWTVRYR